MIHRTYQWHVFQVNRNCVSRGRSVQCSRDYECERCVLGSDIDMSPTMAKIFEYKLVPENSKAFNMLRKQWSLLSCGIR